MSSNGFHSNGSHSFGNMRSLFSMFSSDLAIDLGTANTLVYARGKGIVVNEPSIVAINKNTGEVEAVGKEAKEMLGRTPGNIVAIKPMKDGVIADFKVTEKMLNYFIQKAHNRKMLVHPRIVIGVPVGDYAGGKARRHGLGLSRQGERSASGGAGHGGRYRRRAAHHRTQRQHGGRYRRRHHRYRGHFVERHRRIRARCEWRAIRWTRPSCNYMKRKYNLLIGERTAEQIKIEIGSAYPLEKPLTMEIKGRNLIEGVPKTITIDDSEIREAVSECVSTIMNAIRVALERTPPELSADISDRGIVLTGGGALLKNLDKRIREETGLPVAIADDPLCSVVLGTGKMLSDFKLLRKISID